jgi:RNA polymerase sigma-70 factor (ECF subfamily)
VSVHLNLVETSDQKLIEGCIAGDERCWEGLYRRYYSHVRRTVAWPRWQFSRSEVEDYVQEVFLELMRALPSFRGEASLPTFLTRLAKNKCVSQIRRKTALKRVREEVGYALEERKGSSDEPLAIAVAEGPGPEGEMLAQEEAAGVLKALQTLSPDCQRILQLRYYRELSYDEICTSLGLPLGTVCSRLKRCLERLKKVVEP